MERKKGLERTQFWKRERNDVCKKTANDQAMYEQVERQNS
jgi:hypothetical protein